MIRPMPGNPGRPTESNTIASVTRPTDGTPAVPMEASVAVAITDQIIRRAQLDAERLCNEYNGNTLDAIIKVDTER